MLIKVQMNRPLVILPGALARLHVGVPLVLDADHAPRFPLHHLHRLYHAESALLVDARLPFVRL